MSKSQTWRRRVLFVGGGNSVIPLNFARAKPLLRCCFSVHGLDIWVLGFHLIFEVFNLALTPGSSVGTNKFPKIITSTSLSKNQCREFSLPILITLKADGFSRILQTAIYLPPLYSITNGITVPHTARPMS